MQNPISISTGPIKFTDNLNKEITTIKEFNIDGVELSFRKLERIKNFKLSLENQEWLKSLKNNSVHAPWEGVIFNGSTESEQVLDKLERIYNEYNCHNMVFHRKAVKDFKWVLKRDLNASVENYDWRREIANTPEQVNAILANFPGLKFTFDFAHAAHLDSAMIPYFLDNEQIVEVHFSRLNRIFKHSFHYKKPTYAIKVLKNKLDPTIPIVLEAGVYNDKDLKSLRKEIEFIRNF